MQCITQLRDAALAEDAARRAATQQKLVRVFAAVVVMAAVFSTKYLWSVLRPVLAKVAVRLMGAAGLLAAVPSRVAGAGRRVCVRTGATVGNAAMQSVRGAAGVIAARPLQAATVARVVAAVTGAWAAVAPDMAAHVAHMSAIVRQHGSFFRNAPVEAAD